MSDATPPVDAAPAQNQPTEPAPAPEPAAEVSPAEAEAQLIQEAVASITYDDDTGDDPKPQPESKPAANDDTPKDEILAVAAREAREHREARGKLKEIQEQTAAMQREMQGVLELAKSNPAGFMEKYGTKGWFQEAAAQAIKEPATETSVVERLEADLKSLRHELTQERGQKAHASYMDQIRSQASSDPKYEILSVDTATMADIETFVERHRDMYGRDLPIDKVLDYALETQTERLKKLSETQFWQSQFGNKPAPADTPNEQPTDNGEPRDAGITNAQPTRAVPPVEDDFDPFDEDARIRAAAAAVTWDPD